LDTETKTTNLPMESYDLWEERRGIFTYTASAVHAGLMAAANFAGAFGEHDFETLFSQAAERMKEAIVKYLYDPSIGRFIRGCTLSDGNVADKDSTVDASIAGIFLFGVLPADDPRVQGTMKAIQEKLTVQTQVGGIARYEGDKYQSVGEYDSKVPGNPWFITTLWLAEWYIEIAKSRAELAKPREILHWCASHALPSGIMAEQLNPYNGSPVSVSPLTWSHGAYVNIIHHYLGKFNRLTS